MSDLIQFARGSWTSSFVPAVNEPYYIKETGDLRMGLGSGSWCLANRPITSTYTLYVSPTGNVTSSGLSSGSATTLLSAVDKARSLGWNGLSKVYIQLANGTYNISQSIFWQERKCGPLYIVGNSASPQSVVINSVHTQSWSGIFNSYYGGYLFLDGMSLQTSYADTPDNQQVAVTAMQMGTVYCNNMRFGPTFATQVQAGDHSFILMNGTYNVYGKCRVAAFVAYRSSEIQLYCPTMSFSNNPIIPTFAGVYESSLLNNYAATYFTGANTTTVKIDAAKMSAVRNWSQYPGTIVYTGSMFLEMD